MAVSSSEAADRLRRYPAAPARNASVTRSASACIVTNISFAEGSIFLSCWAASIPFRTGMEISRRITSGLESIAAVRSAWPSSTLPTSSNSGSSNNRIPSSNNVWSSASNKRGRIIRSFLLQQHLDRNEHSVPRPHLYRELSVHEPHPFLHADQIG